MPENVQIGREEKEIEIVPMPKETPVEEPAEQPLVPA